MEGLLKQISTIIFRVEKENKAQTSRVIRDRKISSRRTRSSKGDRRKGQNWHQRQPSHETSHDYDKMEGEEFRTALAAAAFAVNSIENKEYEMKQDSSSSSRKSSEVQEVSPRPQTNEDLHGESNHPTPTMVKMKPNNNVSKKTIGSTMSIDKTSSFVVEKLSDEETTQLDLQKRLGDAWEKTELQKIKERFTKVKAIISEWENKKKLRAKKKLIKKEGKLEWKRARELQDFMRKMQTIENISRGAISQTEENRRNEEDRVKENANMIRSTGKIQKPIYLCCWF